MILLALAVASAPPAYDAAFWRAWGDGQAEIDGYVLQRDRYGERRGGTVVAVFVTEPWSASAQVKADDGKHDKSDVVQVLKLNVVEDFQTGIYDYNLMTSSWTALTAGTAPKIAFSAQEWCGTTYSEVLFDKASATEVVHSYFDGESGTRALPAPPSSSSSTEPLVEDNLLVWARGLAAPYVKPGESATVPFLPALSRARLLHQPLAWTTAKLTRTAGAVDVDVPAGKLRCERARIEIAAGGRSVDVCVEAAAPHRVVSLSSSDGYALALTGTVRTAYWQKNHEGDEAMLSSIGLKPPRSR